MDKEDGTVFVPKGRFPESDIKQDRLTRALASAGITPLETVDLEAFARKVDWALTWRPVLKDAKSVTLAGKKARWFSNVQRHASALAALLDTPIGPSGAIIEDNFADLARSSQTDHEPYVCLTPFELTAALRRLAEAAQMESEKRQPPLCSQPEVAKMNDDKEPSPTPNLKALEKLSHIFEAFTGRGAYVRRLNADGDKGGEFYEFVKALCKEWEQSSPSVETVLNALRLPK